MNQTHYNAKTMEYWQKDIETMNREDLKSYSLSD